MQRKSGRNVGKSASSSRVFRDNKRFRAERSESERSRVHTAEDQSQDERMRAKILRHFEIEITVWSGMRAYVRDKKRERMRIINRFASSKEPDLAQRYGIEVDIPAFNIASPASPFPPSPPEHIPQPENFYDSQLRLLTSDPQAPSKNLQPLIDSALSHDFAVHGSCKGSLSFAHDFSPSNPLPLLASRWAFVSRAERIASYVLRKKREHKERAKASYACYKEEYERWEAQRMEEQSKS